MIDIAIPTANLKYTDNCLKSLFKRTNRKNYRLILVSDMTTQQDHEYLDKIDADVKVFNDGIQKGIPTIWNQGLENMKNDYIIVCNNDILFFDGWLERLEGYVRHHDLDVLSPYSYWTTPPTVGNDNEEELCNRQLLEYSLKNENTVTRGMEGSFFMFRKSVVDKIGPFDTRYWPFNFEDCDGLTTLRKAGFYDFVWHGCSLFHYGASTVSEKTFNLNSSALEVCLNSRLKYYEKWGLNHLLDRPWEVHQSVLYIDGKEVEYGN